MTVKGKKRKKKSLWKRFDEIHAQKFKNDSSRVKCSHRSDKKQLIISCLLSPFSPRWELIVNKDHESSRQKYSERHVYKVLPNQCGFCSLSGFFVIFLNFLQWNLPKFLQHIAPSGMWILNTKKAGFVKAFFYVFQIYVFHLCQKPGLKDFPGMKKIWRKFRHGRVWSPWSLRYRYSDLPTERSSHLGAGYIVSS